MISPQQIINVLSAQLNGNFNIEYDVVIGNRRIPLLAQSNLNFQHYAVSKKIILEEIVVNDFVVCFKPQNTVSELTLKNDAGYLKWFAQIKTISQNQHMRSRFVGFVICDQNSLDEASEKFIRKFHKFYWLKFGFKGWYEIFFIGFFSDSFAWIVPKKGKDFIPLLERLTSKLKTL